ncbi:sugar phosphate isomerase/epimerase [Paenibacillus oryzisoli]|uniref:sugar phosphate isomerase/epimerase family protein n=1 Tax=Paenibacillus oryzisoli TaxID=1850517 RepID=UPI003D2860D4
MSAGPYSFSVFTKPWKSLPAEQLAEKVRTLGFDGIEFPIREGFQVEPHNAAEALPKLSRLMADYGLRIYSVAASTEESVFAACAEAGVPVIRIMLDIDFDEGYWQSEKRIRAYIAGLQPLCERYGVKVGVQQHTGRTRVKTAAGLLRFLEHTDPRCFGAIWDAGHDGLRGEGPDIGLDMLWPQLCMVNLKNAYYRQTNPEDEQQAQWETVFTTGRRGMASWPAVARCLEQRQYEGVLCLTAEYEDERLIDRHIAEDIAYAKEVFSMKRGD